MRARLRASSRTCSTVRPAAAACVRSWSAPPTDCSIAWYCRSTSPAVTVTPVRRAASSTSSALISRPRTSRWKAGRSAPSCSAAVGSDSPASTSRASSSVVMRDSPMVAAAPARTGESPQPVRATAASRPTAASRRRVRAGAASGRVTGRSSRGRAGRAGRRASPGPGCHAARPGAGTGITRQRSRPPRRCRRPPRRAGRRPSRAAPCRAAAAPRRPWSSAWAPAPWRRTP